LEAQLIESRRKLPLTTVQQVRQALQSKPDDANLGLQYITMLYQRLDYEGVVNAFQQAPDSKWNNEMQVYYYGLSLQLLGQADAALETFNRLFRTRPLFFLAPFRIAQIHEQHRRDPAAARAAYQTFLRIPDDQIKKAYPQYDQIYKQMRDMAMQQLSKSGGNP
jgi:tetratricopeptide (TPR) repeat protein